MNDVLARMHKVDYAAVGLTGYGREGGYIPPDVALVETVRGSQTGDMSEMERLAEWLPANMPPGDETRSTMAITASGT